MKKPLIITISFSFLLAMGIMAWSYVPTPEAIAPPLHVQAENEYEELLLQFGLGSKMAEYGVPGTSFAFIKNGELHWAKGYGVLQAGGDEPIDTETLFSVGSVSKVGTAVLILKLLEEGSVNIDEDVNQYLSSWQVPENEYTREQAVTLRHIMSHTAGLTVHGFADFYPGEEQPTTVQILDGVSPAKSAPVRVNIPVGSQFRYSGGGTTVSQLVIEDQTGVCFDQAAKDILFEPLQMTRSSYQNPLPASVGNIAKAHNPLGMAVALPRGYQSMPEAAASGLWTNPTEFSKLMIMLMETYAGNSSYLSQATVQDMMTPVTPSIYGLGPQIKQTESSILFMHGGSNDSYRARFVGDLSSQNGVIIFTNGTNGSALINELWPVFKPLL